MIYFINEVGSQYIKIGFSLKFPTTRLLELSTGNPRKLQLLAYEEGNLKKEKELHKRFKKFHVNLEWYDGVSEDLVNYINNISTDYIEYNKELKAIQIYKKMKQ